MNCLFRTSALFSFQLSTTSGLWAPDDDGCRSSSSSSSSSSSGRPVSAAVVARLPAVRLRIRRIPRPPPPRGFLPTLHFLRRGWGWKWKGAGALSFLPLLLPNKLSLLFRAAESPLPKALLLLPQFPPPPLEREKLRPSPGPRFTKDWWWPLHPRPPSH